MDICNQMNSISVLLAETKGETQMKKALSWLLIVVLLLTVCAGTRPSKAEEMEVKVQLQTEDVISMGGYNDFMALLSAAVMDGQGNKNLSPISVYIALSMVAEGAQGETQAELLALLGEEKLDQVRKNAQVMMDRLRISSEISELIMANSIWMGEQDGSTAFRDAYLSILKESYDAEAHAVRFGEAAAGQKIAAWIREKTREKIDISEDAMRFDADTLAVLLNTIYLKDGWREPFNEELTQAGTFYGLNDSTMEVQYMHQTDTQGTVVRGEGYLRYDKPLSGVGKMVFVLPDEGVTLSSLLNSPERIQKLLSEDAKEVAQVDLMMPKFGFQYRADLVDTLKALGIKSCFTGRADFSPMTDAPAYISNILQESRIGVDENGVEAAAYTMVIMTKNAAIPLQREKVDFHLTRPFFYAIESRDGTILFLGTVTEPDKA